MNNVTIRHHYGGQALTEGVMILGRSTIVTAVRRPSGDIVTSVQPVASILNRRLRRIPFLRGTVVLLESMLLGIKGMLQSAEISLDSNNSASSISISNRFVFTLLTSAVTFNILLVFLVPLFITILFDQWLTSSLAFHAVEGILRLVLFIAFLKLVGLNREVRSVFAYHGAEHKTVNAYEAGEPLETEKVRNYGTAHARCGTSFFFLVFVIAFIVFSLVGTHALWLMVIVRIVLVPVIIGLAYELLFVIAHLGDNRLAKALRWPGMAIQSMTTAEPGDRQLEVAIAAMQKALDNDNPLVAPVSES